MAIAPKISVVMTVYNARRFLPEAVDSILQQTFKDFELVIVDNASTDGSWDLVLALKDDRLVPVRNEKNLGQTKALNIGIRRARGEFIARMDADDISEPRRLQAQHDFLMAHPEVAVVGSWCRDIDAQGRAMRIFKGPTDPLELRCALAASGDLTSWAISHPTVMMRKAVLDAAGGYAEENGKEQGFPQDYDLWSRLTTRGERFANIPVPLVRYRVLEGSESRYSVDRLLMFRYDVTRQRVRAVCPAFHDDEVEILTKMFEFAPQSSAADGRTVLALFDSFFRAYLDPGDWEPSRVYRDRMKFYYVPQLVGTNAFLAVKLYGALIGRYPGWLFHPKFYRKMVKAFLGASGVKRMKVLTFLKKRCSIR